MPECWFLTVPDFGVIDPIALWLAGQRMTQDVRCPALEAGRLTLVLYTEELSAISFQLSATALDAVSGLPW